MPVFVIDVQDVQSLRVPSSGVKTFPQHDTEDVIGAGEPSSRHGGDRRPHLGVLCVPSQSPRKPRVKLEFIGEIAK